MINRQCRSSPHLNFILLASKLLAFTLLVHCSQAGGGDLNNIKPKPNVIGTPIADFNDPAHRAPNNTIVAARGVIVVAVDNYDETNDGKSIGNIYVQDPVQNGAKGTPWSGMTLFQTTLNPPDLFLIPGHGVDVSGPYQPFAGPASGAFSNGIVLPEIVKGSISLSYEGRAPEPIDITLEDLADPQQGMAFVGRLVRIKNVTIQGEFNARQEASITPSGNVVLAGQLFPLANMANFDASPNRTFTSVTGLLNYFYSFKLCPRSVSDIEK